MGTCVRVDRTCGPGSAWPTPTVWDGRWHLEADLDPVDGAVFDAVLNAIVDRMHQDGRFHDLGPENTASRRKAAAVGSEQRQAEDGRKVDRPGADEIRWLAERVGLVLSVDRRGPPTTLHDSPAGQASAPGAKG